MTSSLIAVTFVLHSAFGMHLTTEGVELVEYCNIVVDGDNKGLVVGSCEHEGEMLVESWLERHPDKPWRLIVNGLDYTLM